MHEKLPDKQNIVDTMTPILPCFLKISSEMVFVMTGFEASLTLYLIETPFDSFANRADPDQAALVRASLTLYLIETPFIESTHLLTYNEMGTKYNTILFDNFGEYIVELMQL